MATAFSLDEVFAMAEQIERNGARFYRAAAQATEDPHVKQSLEKLALWEDGHEQTFSRMRREMAAEALAQPAFDPEGTGELYLRAIADQQVFGPDSDPSTWLSGASTSADLLHLAVQFERDSIVFFLGMRQAVPDEHGGAEILRLIDEEVSHVAFLARELERVSAA